MNPRPPIRQTVRLISLCILALLLAGPAAAVPPGLAAAAPAVSASSGGPGPAAYPLAELLRTNEPPHSIQTRDAVLAPEDHWDGTIGVPGMDGGVSALAVDQAGTLYVGGTFTSAGGVPANHIARWDGTTWSALGGGTDGGVGALAVDGSGNLYAASGGTVFRWDGAAWSALGSGQEYAVYTLAVDGSGTLYAGGGGWECGMGCWTRGYIRRWDGTTWSDLGIGGGWIHALAVDSSGNLCAGIFAAGCVPDDGCYHFGSVVRWDGAAWSSLGVMSSEVDVLAVDSSGSLYAGGAFTIAGGVQANHVARWDGAAWSALGTGTDSGVGTLAVDGNGSLYAGGAFTTAGGIQADHVAHWDGTAWAALGSGTNGGVSALAVAGSSLYTGGDFTVAGGNPSAHIARWFNTPPQAADDGYTTAVDAPLVVPAPGVLQNDSDAEGDILTAALATLPPAGTLSLQPNGAFVYTPTLGFHGLDAFTYVASDGFLTDTATALLIIDTAPVVTDDSYTTTEDTPLLVPAPGVLGNDSDPDGDPLTATLATPPLSGTLVLDPEGSLVYTPTLNWNGVDTFTYAASDGLLTATATVRITVTAVPDAPLAADDAYATHSDRPLVVVAPGVLTNDRDPDGDSLTASLATPPLSGTLVLDPDGAFVYTPPLSGIGVDTFVYIVSDGALTDTATVFITVTVNTAPIAADDACTTTENIPLVVAAPGVLDNDSDPDGDPLTAAVSTPPSSGTLALQSDGAFVYTPTLDFYGLDTFTYIASDGVLTDTATVSITVNAPPLAADDAYTTTEDTPLVVAAPGVLGNDSDPDGDPLSTFLATPPRSGAVALFSDGALIYTPTLNWNGVATFTYAASDSIFSVTAAVRITVTAAPDAPLATDDAYATTEDIPLAAAAPGVLRNDSDPDGDPLTAALTTPPAHGAAALYGDGFFIYIPAASWSGLDSFSYTVSDGHLTDTATVFITVIPNTAPIAADDAYATTRDTPLVVAPPGVLGNDRDANGDVLTALLVSPPLQGTLVLNAHGGLAYTPPVSFSGVVSFTYQANDGLALSYPATVRITVRPGPEWQVYLRMVYKSSP